MAKSGGISGSVGSDVLTRHASIVGSITGPTESAVSERGRPTCLVDETHFWWRGGCARSKLKFGAAVRQPMRGGPLSQASFQSSVSQRCCINISVDLSDGSRLIIAMPKAKSEKAAGANGKIQSGRIGKDKKTDYTRWRLKDVAGRQTWHYLTTDEEVKEWPQTLADKWHLGMPLVCLLQAQTVAYTL
jgi:hypothetical protein